jgi:thymidylate synthase (FAD)
MAHEIVPAAEEILDTEMPVLDHGFVRLVDYNGGDQRIVQSARVSYGAGTKTMRQDRGLIQYLLRNRHTSPFEQVNFTFHVKLPIFVARQWVRHRTARLNEISGRYSILKDEFYVPRGSAVAPQAQDNKQGRSTEPFDAATRDTLTQLLSDDQKRAAETYHELLEANLARELARINLPLSTYTEWYWQIDLHNLFHFLELRIDPHAQYEIRVYGEVILDMVRRVAPLATEAFEEHIVGAVPLSRREFAALQSLLATTDADTRRAAGEAQGLEGRELDRFLDKLSSGRQT